MSTRSMIGKLNEDGTVRTIYCHWDGYLEYVGNMLITYYNKPEQIDKLLDLGDISSIGIEPEAYWEDIGTDETKCKTYKARGEEGVDAKVYNSVTEFAENCCEDYNYIFKDGDWYFKCWDDKETDLELVKEKLKNN